jgi:uncharacterized protein
LVEAAVMKVCVLGATGRSGRRIVSAALARGHDVTALVRDAGKARATMHERASIRALSVADEVALVDAMRGHDAVINAAGYVGDGANYVVLVQSIIRCAEAALGANGRFWLFGGAALLDVPGTSIMTLDLPGVPKIFEAHRVNFNAVRATTLDWSMICPGPMTDAPNGLSTRELVISCDIWPVAAPPFVRLLPRPALSLAFKRAIPRMTIHYEDAAELIVANLTTNGSHSRKRIGAALAKISAAAT